MLLIYFILTFASTFGVEIYNQTALTESQDADNELLSWSSPQNFTTLFPYYLSGCDYEDHPVLVLPIGKWNTMSIAVEGGDNLYNLERRHDQLMERLRVGYFHTNTNCKADGTKEIVPIFDYDGFELASLTNFENMNYLMRANKKWEKGYQNVAYGFNLNGNFLVDQLLYMIKNISPRFMEKIEIYGTDKNKFIPQLLRKLPTSVLPLPYKPDKDSTSVEFY